MTPAYWPFALAALFVFMNVLTWVLFDLDKKAARAGRRRIPEATLLGAAGLGGIFGAKLAQRLLRHKTRKEPFRTELNRILAVQAAVFALLLLPQSRAAALAVARDLLAP